MTVRTELGKIKSIEFGSGGYDGAMTGLSVELGGQGWGVNDFKGTWSTRSEHAKWTEADQAEIWVETVKLIRDLCEKAKVKNLSGLHGKPVEVTFEGNLLKSWRILEEVL